jgi:deoxyadenosine/deoxycytidine kinase
VRKINITVNGPIGAGKTTFMERLEAALREKSDSVIVQPEPSVTIPFINDVLKNFYSDNMGWSYPLQVLISGAQEAYLQLLRESDYDYAIMDAAWSSYIYGYSHYKNGRMSLRDYNALASLSRPFKFDYLIWIGGSKAEIISHIKGRNEKVSNGELDEGKKDVEIEDFSYIDSHLEDFSEYLPVYLSKFKSFNPNIKIIKINHIPDINSAEYEDMIYNIANKISSPVED